MNIFENINYSPFIQNKVLSNVSGIKRHLNKWQFRCPICGDGKKRSSKRGWFNLKNNYYICYNGGCIANDGLSGIKFVSLLENKTFSVIKREFLEYIRSNIVLSNNIIETETRITQNENGDIPKEWIELPTNVQEYLSHRKIDFIKNKFFFNNKNKRLVIPWYRNNKLEYWQERLLTNDKNSIRYLFPKDKTKSIYGLDNIDESFSCVFILEGALDSIFVKNGIAIGGIQLNQTQKEILDNLYQEKIFLFDNDETGYKKIIKMIKENNNQKFFIWPKDIIEKDVNEYVCKNNDNLFNNIDFLINNSISGAKALLKIKMRNGL